MKTLTPIRQKILDFLESFTQENGYPPSIREICQAVGLNSTSTVHSHLNILKDAGYLDISSNKTRTISVKNLSSYRSVPIIGRVAAGQPILAQEEITGYVPYEGGGSAELFALEVHGDSMINAAILDGDIVIVRSQPTANHGQIVVALIDDEATVKRLDISRDHVWLMPENPDYSPIDGNNCTILGIVVSLYRPCI